MESRSCKKASCLPGRLHRTKGKATITRRIKKAKPEAKQGEKAPTRQEKQIEKPCSNTDGKIQYRRRGVLLPPPLAWSAQHPRRGLILLPQVGHSVNTRKSFSGSEFQSRVPYFDKHFFSNIKQDHTNSESWYSRVRLNKKKCKNATALTRCIKCVFPGEGRTFLCFTSMTVRRHG